MAEPEVTKRTDAYTKLSDFSDATGWGYTKFDADKKTRLLTGADKITFQPTEMKGQKIELRTIVQNLSDTKLSQVTLQVWVNHADGTIATADGQPVSSVRNVQDSALDRKRAISARRERWNIMEAILIPV